MNLFVYFKIIQKEIKFCFVIQMNIDYLFLSVFLFLYLEINYEMGKILINQTNYKNRR
jgi:hypothetical protein